MSKTDEWISTETGIPSDGERCWIKKEDESTKFSTLNSGFSIESKVCDKCGSVLQQTITTGLRIQKVEPVNSSIKLDPIRTVDEMQEVVNEGNSSMSEPKCTTCGKGKNENVFCSNSFHLCEPVVSQDQEELPHYNIYDPKSCSEMRSELAQLRLKYFNLKLAMSDEAKCECGQNQIDYLATIEIPMCSRCGHKI